VDEIPVLAVLGAAVCQGESRITGAQELRTKESDRIAAMAQGLCALGGRVTELPDGMTLQGGKMHGGAIDARGDHRIAMAFRIASFFTEGAVTIRGAGSKRISYPSFERDLARLLDARGRQGRTRP
jgi:3-phosphoshikimate 1-carboxyvinyltransferase